MSPLLALFVLLFIYAVGDIISAKTNAIISMALVSAVLLCVWFWTGLPKTLLADSGLLPLAGLVVGILLVHMGSAIRIRMLISDWKAALIASIACIGIAAGCYFIGRLFMDDYWALAAAPIAAGGNVSLMIMQGVYGSMDRPDVATFAVLVLVFQTLAGIPIGSIFCKKAGYEVREQYRNGTLKITTAATQRKKLIPPIPDKYNTPYVKLAKMALLSYFGSLLAQWTGFNMLVFDLILGFVFCELGFIEESCLEKANSYPIVLGAALATIFSGLANSTPQMVLSMLIQLLIILAIGIVCMVVFGIICGKIFKMDWKMSVAIASTAYYGFISAYVIIQEVCESLSETPEEKEAMLQYYTPKMLVGAVFSIFLVSSLCATVMAGWF